MSEFTPREFRVFRALGLAIKVWAGNFIPFTVLAAVLYAPAFIWMRQLDPTKATSVDDLVQTYFVIPVYVVVAISTLLAPLLIYRVVKHLNGTPVSFFTSMRYGLRGIVPALIVAAATTAISLIPLGIVASVGSSILLCFWFVASPAAVAERLNPIAALSRSATLTQGRRGGIFGLLFLLGAIVGIALLAWIVPMVNDRSSNPFARFKDATLMFAIVMAVFRTYLGIVEAVSYALLRQEKDGVTHEELARVFE